METLADAIEGRTEERVRELVSNGERMWAPRETVGCRENEGERKSGLKIDDEKGREGEDDLLGREIILGRARHFPLTRSPCCRESQPGMQAQPPKKSLGCCRSEGIGGCGRDPLSRCDGRCPVVASGGQLKWHLILVQRLLCTMVHLGSHKTDTSYCT